MPRRVDPGRRDRIIDAAYASIAENGVKGTTHRVVAAMSDVPLGSMTYHFTSMDELLLAAFTRFTDHVKELVARRFAPGMSFDEAIDAVVLLIYDDFRDENVDERLNSELYSMARHGQRYRDLVIDLTLAGENALAAYFGREAGRAINAYIEGMAVHLFAADSDQPPEETRRVVALLARNLGGDTPSQQRSNVADAHTAG